MAPLMSLLFSGTIKHVVPWKTRAEFLCVYENLYCNDEQRQESALRTIAVWKSRVGSKLSVAIESSGMLRQACLDHISAEKEGKLSAREAQLRCTYSLALIRFVNQVTEKGQTKATAQPVHLIAREFGIPEWIVRLRHDATHSLMPSLDALVSGSTWALNYLRENFWNQQQVVESQGEDRKSNKSGKACKISDIRRAFYDFQKVRYKELNSDRQEKDESNDSQEDHLRRLYKYLTQDRLNFIKCLLEDGVLISTEEQLEALGLHSQDVMSKLPPRIPREMTEFWKPLLKKLSTASVVSFLVQTALFSVTSDQGIRNYQLVAWIVYFISKHSDDDDDSKKVRKKKKPKETFFKSRTFLPKKMMLYICLQNLNGLTAYLLNYFVDKESVGAENYDKLIKLSNVNSKSRVRTSSDESASDNVYTVQDIKLVYETENDLSSSATTNPHHISPADVVDWRISTDIIDWSSVLLGALPNLSATDEDDDDCAESASTDLMLLGHSSHDSDTHDDDAHTFCRSKSSSKRRISNDDDDDCGNNDILPTPKLCKLETDSKLM